MVETEPSAATSVHVIRVAGSDATYRCRADATVLQALSPVHHQKIRSGCHGGGCGVCRVQVLQGEYVTGCMSRLHVSVEDEAKRITLACRTWPRSTLVVEPLGKLSTRLTRLPGQSSKQSGLQMAATQEKR